MHRFRFAASIAVSIFVFAASACSGGGTTTVARSTTTTTVAPVVTTVTQTTSTTTLPTSTTLAVVIPSAPFTGVVSESDLSRPAFVVKIDNAPQARPQWGINQADVVFEELVEGNITRFAAVFHSQDTENIGPVRSARTGDFELLSNLNRPIFGNSGGNPTVMKLLKEVNMVLVGDTNVGRAAYWRSSEKKAPHNLLTSTSKIYASSNEQGGTPPQMFKYRSASEELSSEARQVQGVKIDFGGHKIEYRWNTESKGWDRTQNGSLHVDHDGVQVAPDNVIVQFVRYGQSVAYAGSPEVKVIGTGNAWILTDGQLIAGKWSRPTSGSLTQFTDLEGEIILLTPGTTWIALPRAETAEILENETN